ncbi:hypothetical protein [Sodalis-like endosymbiont of Proechinophthirus fluctus]|uniref:hypothetical protein n=1 Tax=Sodalis-like endosymbiont of Proechinophthirus fluctus TaxID=1462730 RepID=UPI00082BDDC2|nr:hypothetical protein [Sodalis-like endosymbiont of Proechinophthirus fluctus]
MPGIGLLLEHLNGRMLELELTILVDHTGSGNKVDILVGLCLYTAHQQTASIKQTRKSRTQ